MSPVIFLIGCEGVTTHGAHMYVYCIIYHRNVSVYSIYTTLSLGKKKVNISGE